MADTLSSSTTREFPTHDSPMVALGNLLTSAYRTAVPLHVREFGETVLGNKQPITEHDLTAEQIDALRRVIQAKSQSNNDGLINYDDYDRALYSPEDKSVNAARKMTLGNARYSPGLGGWVVRDHYDFENAGRHARTAQLEAMPMPQRLLSAARGAGQAYREYSDPIAAGLQPGGRAAAVAGEFGDALIGTRGRNVAIAVPSRR